jgi:hypothetical protein
VQSLLSFFSFSRIFSFPLSALLITEDPLTDRGASCKDEFLGGDPGNGDKPKVGDPVV